MITSPPPDAADRALQDEIRQLVASRYWRMVRVYLLNRRAQLFAEEPTTNPGLWENRGALREVNRLLYAPEQALFEFAKAKIAGEPLQEETKPFWLGSESP